MLKFLDLFSGIGGFRLGFERAGHECVGHVEYDKYAQKSYMAMHKVKEGEFNGWDIREVRADELPRADCWNFGAPCQDFSIAGKRSGLEGDRSSLVREVFRLVRETNEEDRPEWLLYENVKGMLSSNGGRDFLGILLEMDELGYDIQWQTFNSKDWGVPQNRERVFTLGHSRRYGERKIFPLGQGFGISAEGEREGQGQSKDTVSALTSNYRKGVHNQGETYIGIKQVGNIDQHKRERTNPHTGRVYSVDGISPCLSTMQGGGLEPKILQIGNVANTESFGGNPQRGRVYDPEGISPCLNGMCGPGGLEPKILALRGRPGEDGEWVQKIEVNENGVTNTLTTVQKDNLLQENARIRKLTPRECFRLQGFPDDYFDRAAAVNSDSQLYKQAGNSVTVNVIYEIAKRLEVENG